MSNSGSRAPLLVKHFRQYLHDEKSAAFITAVSRRYTIPTLQRLTRLGSRTTRRAATLALGLLAGYESNAVMGRALNDPDRAVRMLAENGIRQLWCRDGNERQQKALKQIIRLNTSHQYNEAVKHSTELIDDAPWFAEAWNQRAVAYFHLGRYEESANDSHQTLELNAYHFGAAVGMGYCYLETDDAFAALECFRRALRLNPDLEGVRVQVEYLQRSLEGS